MLNHKPERIQMTIRQDGLGGQNMEITYNTDLLRGEELLMIGMPEYITFGDAAAAILEQADLQGKEPMHTFSDGVPFVYPVRMLMEVEGSPELVHGLLMPTRKKEEQR